jgi:NAD(P)-dependent dehydrogenase (short-subunit alcohol dehydrogenase family)
MVSIEGATAVVTGGQRGLGKALTTELLRRGAVKVYATARTPAAAPDPRIVPAALDVTSPESVADLAARAGDASIVINSAGMAMGPILLTADLKDVTEVFDTNVFGPLRMAQGFAPVLARHGGGALVNVHSVLSWAAGAGAYGASKAALWSVTNSLRLELAPAGTQVTGVHVGHIDTDMTAQMTAAKNSAAKVAASIVSGIEAGETEILVDDPSRYYKARLSGPVQALTFDPALPLEGTTS